MKSIDMFHVYKVIAVAAIVITATLSGQAHAQSEILNDNTGFTVQIDAT